MRNSKTPRIAMRTIALAVALIICAGPFAVAAPINPVDSFQRGDSVKMPPLKTLDGKTINFDKISKDKVVVLAFWLHSCETCVDSIQKMGDYIASGGRDKKVVMLTVTRGDSKTERQLLKKSVSKWRRKYPVVLDPNLEIARAYDAFQAPSFIAIGRDGKIKTPVMFYIDEKIRDIDFRSMISLLIKGYEIPEVQFIDYTQIPKFRKMIGTAAPDFALTSTDRREYKLSDYRGRMNVVLVFWHPYCRHCESMMDQLVKYYNAEQKSNDYVVLAVSSIYGYGQEDSVNKFLNESGARFPVLSDQDSKIGAKYGVSKIPTMFFIDKSGKIFDIVESPIKSVRKHFDPVLAAMSPGK